VAYIAQVLKRNRTLKVLNLSDNKIEAPGLTALAEALVRTWRDDGKEYRRGRADFVEIQFLSRDFGRELEPV
jgi:Ran GTPase-activating protein (RanGAP) involved in mRNA processing and transport